LGSRLWARQRLDAAQSPEPRAEPLHDLQDFRAYLRPSSTYEPRCPAQTALYQIVRDHLETFRCRGVVAVFVRAVLGFLRARARWDGVADGRGGAERVASAGRR